VNIRQLIFIHLSSQSRVMERKLNNFSEMIEKGFLSSETEHLT